MASSTSSRTAALFTTQRNSSTDNVCSKRSKTSSIFSLLFLLLVILCSLSNNVAANGLHQPSYYEKLTTASRLLAQARIRNAEEAANGYSLAEDEGIASPWDYYSDLQEGDTNSPNQEVLQQLLNVGSEKLRQTLQQSLSSLSSEEGRRGGGDSSSSSSSSSSRGAAESGSSGRTVSNYQETPEDYHTCLNHTAEFVLALAEGQKWALLMIDAMGKPSPAVSEGNFMWPGAFGMCHKIRANTTYVTFPYFSGKYCNAYTQLKGMKANSLGSGAMLVMGLCVPSTCSEFDLSVLLSDVVSRLGVPLQVGAWCPPRSTPLDTKAIVCIVICSVLLLFMILGTGLDVWLQQMEKRRMQKSAPYVSANGHSAQEEHVPLLPKSQPPPGSQPSLPMKLLMAFSVYTNGRKLLSTQQTPGSLTCVHGIRFLSMTWVVLGHVYLFPMTYGENVAPYMQEFMNRWTAETIINALVSVDSFFVLSGLLVSYLTLKELQKKNGKLNWFMFYFHRFWRLTPAYMLVIMVYVCLFDSWVHGPFWSPANADKNNCENNWWTNLLYINNLVKTDKMCLGQSWYLANDMQFYCILSPLVIVPLYFFPIAGYVVAGLLVLTHCVTNAALTMQHHYPPGMFAQIKVNASTIDMATWGPDFYMKPYTRWGPYVIGMLAGYFLYVNKCKMNIKWHVNSLLWALATASALAVLYGLYGATTGHPMTLSTSAFYNAMHRNVWAVCLCWVVVACVTGNGGFVNTLLSWPGFMPLSRLTYCIYLLHIMICEIYLLNMRTTFYYDDISVVMFFLSILVVSYMASAVASLAFEAPMMALEKVLLSSRDQSRDSANLQKRKEEAEEALRSEQRNGETFYTTK